MKEYKCYKVDDDMVDMTRTAFPKEGRLLEVFPPDSGGGVSSAEEFLQAVHVLDMKHNIIGNSENASPVCGMEIWYEQEEFKIMFFTPNEETEEMYRKQLAGYYDGISLESKEDYYIRSEDGEFKQREQDKFINIESGDWITGARCYLKNHFFEPIAHRDITEPFKPIFNELDSKDGTRGVIQILFKPARKSWTRTPVNDVEQYAEGLRQNTRVHSKYWGLVKREESVPSEEKQVAGEVEGQRGKKAYHVNVRFMLVGDNEQALEKHSRFLDDIIEKTYEKPTGQSFDPRGVRYLARKKKPLRDKFIFSRDKKIRRREKREIETIKELLEQMVSRQEYTMEPLRGVKDYFKEWMLENFPFFGDFYYRDIVRNRMIMTIPELSGIAHLPGRVKDDGIRWGTEGIGGSLPGGAQQHQNLKDERREQLEKELAEAQKEVEEVIYND